MIVFRRWIPVVLLCATSSAASLRAQTITTSLVHASLQARGRAPAQAAGQAAAGGATIFARCTPCHQANGAGVPGAFPPLAGSSWVTGPMDRPIAILLHGLQGPLTVSGAAYNGVMLPYGTNVVMTDAELAAVLTYIRTSWGNRAAAVTVADIARVRAKTKGRTKPFSEAELLALR